MGYVIISDDPNFTCFLNIGGRAFYPWTFKLRFTLLIEYNSQSTKIVICKLAEFIMVKLLNNIVILRGCTYTKLIFQIFSTHTFIINGLRSTTVCLANKWEVIGFIYDYSRNVWILN